MRERRREREREREGRERERGEEGEPGKAPSHFVLLLCVNEGIPSGEKGEIEIEKER